LPSFFTSLRTFRCRTEVKQQQTHPLKGEQHDGYMVCRLIQQSDKRFPRLTSPCLWWFLFIGAVASSAATVGLLCELYRCSGVMSNIPAFTVVPIDPPTLVTAQSLHGIKPQLYYRCRVLYYRIAVVWPLLLW
jgi:hypothetical protein